jgi:hypothetical protein
LAVSRQPQSFTPIEITSRDAPKKGPASDIRWYIQNQVKTKDRTMWIRKQVETGDIAVINLCWATRAGHPA